MSDELPTPDSDEPEPPFREPTVTPVSPAPANTVPIGPIDVPESARTMINMSQRGRVIQ